MSHRYLLCVVLLLSGCEIVQDSSGYTYDTAVVPSLYHTSLWAGSFNIPAEGSLEGTESYTFMDRSEQQDDFACELRWGLIGERVANPVCASCVFEVQITARLEEDSTNDGSCDALLDATFVYALSENYQSAGMALLHRSVDDSEFQPFIQSSAHTDDFAAELTIEDDTFTYRGGYYHYTLP